MNYLSFFPYEQFRKNQEEIIKQIESSSKLKKNVLLLAPNGTGKTIIALCGLLPLAYEKNLKIIYMCRTHSQNRRIIKELIKISQKINEDNLGVKLNAISIRGRNEMCLNQTLLSLKLNPREAMSVCADLRKNRNCIYFLNLLKKKGQIENPLSIAPELFNKPVDAEELITYCKEKKFCPYFLSKFLLETMKIIICNYQWTFNPFIRESFLEFIGQELNDCILVIDECHNIIDVATEVNSIKITPYSLRLCLKDLEMYRSPILMQSFVKILIDQLNKEKKRIRSEEKAITPDIFLELIYKKLGFNNLNKFKIFIEELHDFSTSIHEEKLANGEISRDYVGSLAEFWLKWLKTYYLDNYFFCYSLKEFKEKASISLEIVALDPREIAIPILKKGYTCLNLSGTVNAYVYNNLMGLNECGKTYKGIIAGTPFSKKNIKAVIIEGIDTKRDNRRPDMFKKMIKKIDEVLYCTPENVGIFCASYQILKALLDNGIETITIKNKKKLFIEESGLSASENALLVDEFKSMASNGGAVLLGVCGGRNSEGEDYPGNLMNSVIIAGFPYHLPTPRVEAKIKYYDKVFKKQGWNFAYLYPAIQRANQASGRPIRKISDKGAIIFMDSRFKTKYKWISEWLRNELEIIPDKPNAIIQNLSTFWKMK
ncbi:MAG: helicase C-terminal domain-containing protein [Promethearchaeota archaeon]